MSKEILINSGIREVRAAVLTGGNVSEIFIERVNKKSAAGNIYKGKVVKVLPGMQSAFVEIGLQRAAFLHIADIYIKIDAEPEGVSKIIKEDHVPWHM